MIMDKGSEETSIRTETVGEAELRFQDNAVTSLETLPASKSDEAILTSENPSYLSSGKTRPSEPSNSSTKNRDSPKENSSTIIGDVSISMKRSRDDDEHPIYNVFDKRPRVTEHADASRLSGVSPLIVEHYNALPNRDIRVRKSSSILGLKNFNNWVKAVLINQYVNSNDNVLDLCCGKGGDLFKYIAVKIGYLVGVDIAEKSIDHFKERYHSSYVRSRSSGMVFPAQLFVADCFQESICDRIDPEIRFQAVSCQFALHYAFESEIKLRQAFRNITDRLSIGGHFFATLPDANVILKRLEREIRREKKLKDETILDFMKFPDLFPITFGNSQYSIKFENPPSLRSPYSQQYIFTLNDAIYDCPEYLVHFPTLSSLAKEYGLECIYRKSFHSFFYHYCDHPSHHELIHRLKVFLDGRPLSVDEWNIAYLYYVCVFRKVEIRDQSRLSI